LCGDGGGGFPVPGPPVDSLFPHRSKARVSFGDANVRANQTLYSPGAPRPAPSPPLFFAAVSIISADGHVGAPQGGGRSDPLPLRPSDPVDHR